MTEILNDKPDEERIGTKLEDNEDDDDETAAETPVSSPEREIPASPDKLEVKFEEKASVEEDDETPSPDAILSKIVKTKEKNDEEEDYSNWPVNDIKDPHSNDVLYGRGGGTNHHPGNKRYRKLVEGRKVDYVNSKRLDKPLVALEIIKEWRSQKPPGRFLKIDDQTGFWNDVGDKKAREKTSQALREKAPLLRKQQEEQRKEKEIIKDGLFKNTRFDLPEKSRKVNRNLGRVLLRRDHSLGRDYISPDEPVSVKGFSWTTPVMAAQSADLPKSDSWETKHRESSAQPVPYAIRGSGSSIPHAPNQLPTQSPYVNNIQYPGTHSQDPMHPVGYGGDWANQYPHNPHTPLPHEKNMLNEWRGFHSDDATRKTYRDNQSNYPQPHSADDMYQRSRSGYYHHDNPSSNSHIEGNDYDNFASVVGPSTDYNMPNWANMNSQPGQNPKNMYEPTSYHSPLRMQTGTSYRQNQNWTSPPHADQASPQSSVDYYNSGTYRSKADTFMSSPYHNISSPGSREDIPRPPTVKRDTSNKLRTIDVEPTKKRMNRQSSMSSVDEITENDIKHLKQSLEQSSLVMDKHPLKKPQNLKFGDRLSTIDRIIVDLGGNSPPLDGQTKIECGGSVGSLSVDEVIAKPSAINDDDRISTIGTLDMDNDFFGGLTNAAPV